jgi:pimeloyl-ACP methyl ester carboxylesterase
MYRAPLADIELEYETRGTGEHVLFIHHGAGADWFAPLCDEPMLTERYCLVRYHRQGYAGSSPLSGQLTFAREAESFRALMRHLGIQRAHIVGHSASGCIALQFALDASEIVRSVVLFEPALMAVPSPPEVPRALELYRAGDMAAAVETFLRGTCGPDARHVLEDAIPGAVQQALVDADTFFGHELPALRQWKFGPDEARRITQPVLAVVGENSDSRFHQRQELLLDWLPNVEPFLLRDAGHLLSLQNARDSAHALAAFFARHPFDNRSLDGQRI